MLAGEKTNVGLDMIRGVAALLVVLGHSRSFLGSSLSSDLTFSLEQKIVLLPASFAQEAVALFFVLSGYLVGGQVLREVVSGRFRWRAYMSKRLSRLWTVLIPGIAFTFIVDSLTVRFFGTIWPKLAGGSLSAESAACNAAFLQVSRCNTYGSNDSLWSLSFEFWFYVIFAAAVVAVWSALRRAWVPASAGVMVCVATVLIFGVGLFVLIPSWLLGAALAAASNRWKKTGVPSWLPMARKRTLLTSVGLTMAAMLASNVLSPPDWVRFTMVGLASAPLILLTALRPWGQGSRVVGCVAQLGSISFSLYVFHLPLAKFFAAAFATTGGAGSVGNTLAVYALTALAVALSIPLWALTENRTSYVRDWMLRL